MDFSDPDTCEMLLLFGLSIKSVVSDWIWFFKNDCRVILLKSFHLEI